MEAEKSLGRLSDKRVVGALRGRALRLEPGKPMASFSVPTNGWRILGLLIQIPSLRTKQAAILKSSGQRRRSVQAQEEGTLSPFLSLLFFLSLQLL